MNTPPTHTRRDALQLLSLVLTQKMPLDDALAMKPLQGAAADVRFVMMLVLTTLRHVGQIDTLLANYLEKPLPPKREAVINALRIGVVQLLLLDTPAHAAVNETVDAVKQGKDTGLTGLVNAILQRIAREKPTLPDAIHNLPQPVKKRWEKYYGAENVAAIAAVAATRPPLDIHSQINIANAVRLDGEMLRLPPDHPAVETLPGYAEGEFFVQDIAASYPARMLGEVRGLRVLDACAAPGGKTAQLARAGAQVTALDRSASRMTRLKENMARLKLNVETIVADALEYHPAQPFDAILLDAPCSATGTWRRHPEVLQLVTDADVSELVELQRAMLARSWGWLKPGGKLVYCVCSLERAEGEGQAAWFTQSHPDAALQPPPTEIPPHYIKNGMLRTLPSYLAEQGGMDGFFGALFQK